MIDFSKARNGSLTCSVGGKYLHSVYNPERESERFVLQLQCDFSPKVVILTEPGLSYCARFLRQRFPCAKIAAIRFCKDFSKFDAEWDFVFFADENLDNALFNVCGEEMLSSALFASWQSSETLFPSESERAWQKIKSAVLKSRDILATRSFFSKRWLKNSVRFFSFAQKMAAVRAGKSDIVVAASGPSLKLAMETLKKYREKFFLIAVSSALKPLLSNKITPDLCISTDGGQWAKRHLEILFENPEISVALSAESATPYFVLAKNPVVPLFYGDAPECVFAKNCGIPAIKAFRNGTVSGTAVQCALGLTNARVFCCGLDLSEAKGFQHTQPNALDEINAGFENRLQPRSTRLSLSGRPNGSLSLYRDWFSAQTGDFAERVFRLAGAKLNPLGNITDLSAENFEDIFKKMPKKEKPVIKIDSESSFENLEKRREIIKKNLQEIKNLPIKDEKSVFWLKNVFPVEFLQYEKYVGFEKQKYAEKDLLDKRNEFFSEIISDFEKKLQ